MLKNVKVVMILLVVVERRKQTPLRCFFCGDESRHFLGNCQKFKNLSHERKRQAVMGSGRCLNCLSLGHVVRNCAFLSKCRRCGPKFQSKHAGTLHEFRASEYCCWWGRQSEPGATVGEIEVGGASSDDDRPRTVVTYQKLPRTVLKPEIQIKSNLSLYSL